MTDTNPANMTTAIKADTRVLEILASKICHDLISPIGAINNGIEFLEEMGPDAAGDAAELIGISAAQASAKLRAYRLAYGLGGADPTHKPEDVHSIINALIGESGKISQSWEPDSEIMETDGTGTYPKGFCKLLTALLLLAMDSLPKGGTLHVEPESTDATIISIRGPVAALREGIEDALLLKTTREDLHTKVIHAYVCGLLAKQYGFSLDHTEVSGEHIKLEIRKL